MTKKKIVLGPIEIAGNTHSLYKSLKDEGKHVTLFLTNFHPHHPPVCIIQKIDKYISIIHFKPLRRFFRVMILPLQTIIALYHIITKDIFIFYFGTSFLPFYLDLPILKFLNKKMIMVYCGSDSRFALIDGARVFNLNKNNYIRICNRNISRLKIVEKYVNTILANPFSSQLHQKEIINILNIGIPYTAERAVDYQSEIDSPIKILHCPSDLQAKGTFVIRKVIEKLKQQFDIEYIELSGVPHSEVKQALVNADCVIDQLYSDQPIPGFATEAMNFGKPVFIGSYAKTLMKDYVKFSLDCIILFNPDEFESVLYQYLNDTTQLKQVSQKALDHYNNNLNNKTIANNWINIINDSYPTHWKITPQNINYFYGSGVSKEYLTKKIKELDINWDLINLPNDHKLIQFLKQIN